MCRSRWKWDQWLKPDIPQRVNLDHWILLIAQPPQSSPPPPQIYFPSWCNDSAWFIWTHILLSNYITNLSLCGLSPSIQCLREIYCATQHWNGSTSHLMKVFTLCFLELLQRSAQPQRRLLTWGTGEQQELGVTWSPSQVGCVTITKIFPNYKTWYRLEYFRVQHYEHEYK